MELDINEELTVKKLRSHFKCNSLKHCSLADFQKISGLDESWYFKTIKSINSKGYADIGFVKRDSIIKVKNWFDKYKPENDYYISLTKKGRESIDY